jgi:hypothetical protein
MKSKKYRGRLWGMRCYLIGAMDRVADRGVEWREDILPFLHGLGVVPLNPCDKPIKIGTENIEDAKRHTELIEQEKYDELREEISLFRAIDLRMVDISDFLICNIDTSVHACGTYEEFFWANRLKRPILTVCKQGKKQAPRWLFGAIPHQHIFSNYGELKYYMLEVDNKQLEVEHYNRWLFFDYENILPN